MPNIDTSTIEGFETMSPEEKISALLKYDIPERIDMSQYVPKEASNNLASENKKLKDQLKAQMTEEQRAAAEREAQWNEMKAKLETLEREKVESTYKASYLALGYEESLAVETAKALADGDMEKVFANQRKNAEAQREKIESELTRQDPRYTGPGGKEKDEVGEDIELARILGKKRGSSQTASDEIMKHYMK